MATAVVGALPFAFLFSVVLFINLAKLNKI